MATSNSPQRQSSQDLKVTRWHLAPETYRVLPELLEPSRKTRAMTIMEQRINKEQCT
jgi:hypothetical protein